ncbi:MAG TPA: sigma-70 family RNA polymerase sigma factor [Acidimicrobiales bacterium]|nr:sigma-70 family RNA polymerase sigma factor [Acidimicrobiales bacterium]
MAPGMSLGESFESTLAAAQAGAEWAFSCLYRELNPRLLRYFASRVPGEAEDLAVETWLGAARRIGDFRGDQQHFRAWVFTIAHGRLVQHWRDARRMPPTTGIPPDLAGRAAPDDVEAGVLDCLTGVEASSEIVRALSFDQAEVFLLRVLGGLSVDEVAGILGKRPGTVRVLQHKALRRLATSPSVLMAVNAMASGRD